MNVWKAGTLGLSLAIVVTCGGCRLSDAEGGLQLSRMIPTPDFGSPVPEQHEPDPGSLYAAQSTDEESPTDEP